MKKIELSQDAQLEIIDEYLRRDLYLYLQRVFEFMHPKKSFQGNWHLECICEHLIKVYRGEIKRLIINMPPRWLKSETISVAFSSWLMGHRPDIKIMAASFKESLAIRDNVRVRRIIQESDFYKDVFPKVKIVGDQNEKKKFETKDGGYRMALSVGGGGGLGDGCDLFLIDDPHKADKHLSSTSRQAAIDWWENTAQFRLNDQQESAVILVMQRLHSQDLTGYLQEKGGWVVLKIPALDKKGESNFPTRYPTKLLQEMKKNMLPSTWEGQQMQEPFQKEGGIIETKNFGFFEYEYDRQLYSELYISVDTAVKDKAINDYTAITILGKINQQYDLVHAEKDKLNYPNLIKRLLMLSQVYKPTAIIIEDKNNGAAAIQDLQENTNLPVIAVNPKADKITRANLLALKLQEKRIRRAVIEPKWWGVLEEELRAFPNAAHDDYVDALSQFVSFINQKIDNSEFYRQDLNITSTFNNNLGY